MRSFLLVILSALVLAGLFIGYWTMQPASHRQVAGGERKVVVIPHDSDDEQRLRGFHPGDRIWLKEYDAKGELSSAFSATHYITQPDGTVKVIEPVAEFFLANRQRLEITGDTGHVVVKDAPDLTRSTGPKAPMGPPNRGRLDHVKMVLLDDSLSGEAKKTPLLTMTTNNVAFDNETFRISTEGYRDEQGREIADDQVPVHVTGQYEFEGRGLTVRWNDKDGRLDLLEIAHGDYLKVNNPSSFSPTAPKRHGKPVQAALVPWEWLAPPLPEMLAAKNKGAEADIIRHHPQPSTRPGRGATKPARGPTQPVVYLASFFDDVRVTQQDPTGAYVQLAATADRMDVNFLMKQSKPEATTKPATQPTTAPAATEPAPPETQPSFVAAIPASQPTTQPTSRPSDQPVVIRWTGILRITPLLSAPPAPLAPGDALVTLTGAPVVVNKIEEKQQGTEETRSGSLMYQTNGERVTFRRSSDFPHVLITRTPGKDAKNPAPTHVVSDNSVEFSRAERKGILHGVGQADIPLDPEPGHPHPMLHAAWTKQAEFSFLPGPEGNDQLLLDHARFTGDTNIRHPKLTLRSQELDLMFDPARPENATAEASTTAPAPAKHQSQPNLREVVATSRVFCQLKDAASLQTIECNRLQLDTALDGKKLYPRHVNATGSVHAYAEDDLRAQYVDLLLAPDHAPRRGRGPTTAPTTAPAANDQTVNVQLEKMYARDHVVARSKDGTVASGDELTATGGTGHQHIVLTSPTNARVVDAKKNAVAGPVITFDQADGHARVVGPGTLHSEPQEGQEQNAPMDVSWQTGAEMDAPHDRIDVTGSVLAKTTSKDGFVTVATGQTAHIDLHRKPVPATAPATRPAATQPAGMQIDPFKGKQVAAITLDNGAEVTSTLSDAQGGVIQQFELAGPTIIYRELGENGLPAKSVTVPRPGNMLVRDHRTPDKKKPGDESSAPGATAFRYDKLVYLDAAQQAVMTGHVVVVHKDDDPKSPPVRMTGDKVTAWFEPPPRKDPKAPPQPKVDKQSGRLKYIVSEGGIVRVTRDTAELEARRIDYDPKRHLIIAIGSSQNPVQYTSADGTEIVTAEKMTWDTITWQTQFTHIVARSQPPRTGTPPPPAAKAADRPSKKDLTRPPGGPLH